jgi:hypothetical protein
VLKANVGAAKGKVAQTLADLDYDRHQKKIYERLMIEDSTRADDVTLWTDKEDAGQATLVEAQASLEAAQLTYESNINGVNTNVAKLALPALNGECRP